MSMIDKDNILLLFCSSIQ